jgi:hypothetical protein
MTSPLPAGPDDRPVLRIASHGDLIATIPTLLGFVPTDSAVIIGTRHSEVAAVARIDLADADALAEHLHRHRLLDPAHTAEIVIVADHPGNEPLDSSTVLQMPYESQVTVLTSALTAAGYHVSHAAWTPTITAGQSWRCYHQPLCGGVLPDPQTTVVATAAVISGRVTYPSRAALAQTLRPDPDPVLDRRAALITTLTGRTMDRHSDRAAGLRLVDAAVARAQAGHLPATDTEIAELAAALTNPLVRDASLRHGVGATSRAAQRLWITLVRATQAPYRAEPAVLLAVTAYLDGDGPLASIAAQLALDARPGHSLAEVILVAVRAGLPPEQLRTTISELFSLS